MNWALRWLRSLPVASRIYLALALFNLVSAAITVALFHDVVASFSASVAASHAWADRADALASLTKIAGDANAPGNDVFESNDVPTERARRDAAVATFGPLMAATRRELGRALAPAVADPIVAKLALAEVAMERMVVVGNGIFDAIAAGDTKRAGERMAAMDKAFADIREAIDDARRGASVAQGDVFSEQHRAATRARSWQGAIAALVLVLMGAVTTYGLRITAKFAEAERALSARNRDMKLVFDNISQGFFTLNREGRLASERSRVVDQWLGAYPAGLAAWEYLSRSDAEAASWFQVAFEGVVEDFLPLEVSLAQMPRRLVAAGRPLGLEYQPIYDGPALAGLLVVMTDLTHAEERARSLAEQRETLALFDAVAKDRTGAEEFVDDARRLVATVTTATEIETVLRDLHTLKGNASTFGQDRLAAMCHELETRIGETSDLLDEGERRALTASFTNLESRAARFLGGAKRDSLVVDAGDYREMLDAIARRSAHEELAQRLLTWRRDEVRPRLGRLAEQAQVLARRLGKRVSVEVATTRVRLPEGDYRDLFGAMVHVVRNAVDHGIETADERRAAGKSEEGKVTFHAYETAAALVIEIGDDGRGVDYAALAARAEARGLSAKTDVELESLLFVAGLSTRDTASEVSGRGVGTSAIKRACDAQGVTLRVQSKPGVGTTFTFHVPRREIAVPRLSLLPAYAESHALA